MIVRKLSDIMNTENDVNAENWRSRRLLLKKDGMGFSVHDTIIRAGTETTIWYKNHLEAVYCIEGDGEIEVVQTGDVFPIEAGTIYALNGNEKHYLRGGKKDMRMVCVFNPPVTGRETHDEDGSYKLVEDE